MLPKETMLYYLKWFEEDEVNPAALGSIDLRNLFHAWDDGNVWARDGEIIAKTGTSFSTYEIEYVRNYVDTWFSSTGPWTTESNTCRCPTLQLLGTGHNHDCPYYKEKKRGPDGNHRG